MNPLYYHVLDFIGTSKTKVVFVKIKAISQTGQLFPLLSCTLLGDLLFEREYSLVPVCVRGQGLIKKMGQ